MTLIWFQNTMFVAMFSCVMGYLFFVPGAMIMMDLISEFY